MRGIQGNRLMAHPHEVLLGSDQFMHAGNEYLYSQVTSLAYYAVKTTYKLNFVTNRVTYNTDIDIYIEGIGHPLEIRQDGSSWALLLLPHYFEEKQTREKATSVTQLYSRLAEKTFVYRMERYLQIIEEFGCFSYDGKRFFPDGSVLDSTGQVNLRTGRVYKRPFEVFVRLPKSIGKKLIHRFVKDQDFVISTKHDADVFFALLEKLYGIRWSSGLAAEGK